MTRGRRANLPVCTTIERTRDFAQDLSANMKSPSFRQPPSIKRPASLSSRPLCAIRVENGSARLGRFALSRTWRAPNEWARRSPMRGVMRFSHWRALPARMISTRRTSMHPSRRQKFGTKQPANGQTRPNGRQRNLARKSPADRQGQLNSTAANPALKERLSAVLRDQLRNQLNDIDSAEAAAIWARRILPARNSLCAADARQLEDAFEERLAGLNNARPSPVGSKRKPVTSLERKGPESTETSTIEKIEPNGFTHAEPRQVRDREHVKFVAGHPCLICGRRPADPHHLRFAQSRALGRKVSDEFTVPLCRGHHREVHRCGDEGAWWAKVGVDPLGVANALWRDTHPLT